MTKESEKVLGLDDIVSDAQDFIFIKKEITATQRIYYLESEKQSDICPKCGKKAHKVKTRYYRKVKHGSLDGKEIILVLKVHQFICENTNCSKKSFSENVPFTAKWSQRSNELNNRVIAEIAQNGFRGSVKVLKAAGINIGTSSTRRLFSRIKIKESKYLPFIGIDDVAILKGHTYMSVVYNGWTHAPVALLNGRTIDSVAPFFKEHPEISLVARDRDSAYAAAVSTFLPESTQVADRYHLLNNMSSQVLFYIRQQLPKKLFFIDNKRVGEEEFKKIQPQKKKKELDAGPKIMIDKNFFLPPDRILVGLDEDLALENKKKLNHQKTIQEVVKTQKSDNDYTTIESAFPTVDGKSFQRKDIFRYIISNKTQRSQTIQEFWPVITSYYPFLDELLDFSTEFYNTIMGDDPDSLDDLLERFQKSSFKSLCSSISKDIDAVKNSIIHKSVSSGMVEGSNNKLKLIKRKGYGNFSVENLEKMFKLNYKLYHGVFEFELEATAQKEYFAKKTKRKNDQSTKNHMAA